ncbi:MAG: hypothetical protein RID15_00600 [Marinovum algicola]|jgi:hypothetical protein|uniref:Uncharacterized protein n=1 Tax=Marinovum algicola TaxID=42444 RepID=A0A975W9H7_9RHOB|nr:MULTISPECIES: hypothetical protein [Marinovum]AKO97986.1 hypothetical protein MALG_02832 [Marinovum algicola DG 898]MDD9741899.1 hypothetical protein [Marinovum sp. SP66]MDD9744989.1 hypothetical protein [Marinovum sp. PR37]SEJ36655.1 hypothetical protein SAMN04487940_105124 [Marinovum algicola]SLN39179.1 hypothetical protein MAA5396_01871 [Marinovum algicola]
MSETLFHFDKRVNRIARKNRKLARGHVNFIDRTGVIRQRPRRGLTGVPLRGLLTIGLGFVGFKGLLIAHQGPVQYEDKLALLAEGTIFEQGAAWAMQIEPVSQAVARFIAPLLM